MAEFEVAVGQVWADADPRAAGRRFEIVEVADGYVRGKILSVERNVSQKKVGTMTRKMASNRFRSSSRGYRLVSNPATGTAVAS
jgi:hypothetical protein